MSAQQLIIKEKAKTDLTTFVGLRDFKFTVQGTIDSNVLFNDPTITLYGYDHANDFAIFVQTPSDIDLTQAPFFYQAQYQYAECLYTLPMAEFVRLAELNQREQHPITMLHSVGRCGSTLLSQLFDAMPNTVSLSEPDIFTNFLLMREQNGRLDDKLITLLKSTLIFLQKPLSHHAPAHWAIKFRSANFELADLIYKTGLPQHNIFLYRNIYDRTRSAIRAFDLEGNKGQKIAGDNLQRWLKLVPMLNHYKRQAKWGQLNKIDLSVLAWLSRMEKYLSLAEQNVPLIALKYEDLITNPNYFIAEILAYIGYVTIQVSDLIHVFEKDSQAGSPLAQQRIKDRTKFELDAKQHQKIDRFFNKKTVISSPFYVLPHTILPKVTN